ncbi:MAG: hypothetical protein ACLUVY_03960 [Bacteroides uniformis]
MKDFFREEIFPYLQPGARIAKTKSISFLRDNRLYLAIRLYLKGRQEPAILEAVISVFRDETAVQQSAPFHRAAQAWEKLLPDVH